MRALFVVSGLGLWGAERQIVMLSKEFTRQGHAASIYTLNHRPARLDELAGTGVEVVMDQKRRRLDFGVLMRLRRHIRAWRPDIVHGFLYDGNLYARLAGCGAGVPVLNSERNDNYVLSLTQRIGYRITSLLCGGIVANSYAGADFARRLHRTDNVDVVWNGIDLHEVDARVGASTGPARQIFPERGVKPLCMVAAIKPQKDHRLALRTMRRLVDEDPAWRLICVGDELADGIRGYKAQLFAERDRLQLEPFVRFVGERRDVLELISSSDVLLVTSLYEGFPNVVLEAMACGTAVVSTDYSDVRRILPLAEQVVGSRREHDIAQAVQRAWVERHATAPASAAALVSVYAKYLEGRASDRAKGGRPASAQRS